MASGAGNDDIGGICCGLFFFPMYECCVDIGGIAEMVANFVVRGCVRGSCVRGWWRLFFCTTHEPKSSHHNIINWT